MHSVTTSPQVSTTESDEHVAACIAWAAGFVAEACPPITEAELYDRLVSKIKDHQAELHILDPGAQTTVVYSSARIIAQRERQAHFDSTDHYHYWGSEVLNYFSEVGRLRFLLKEAASRYEWCDDRAPLQMARFRAELAYVSSRQPLIDNEIENGIRRMVDPHLTIVDLFFKGSSTENWRSLPRHIRIETNKELVKAINGPCCHEEVS